MGLLDTIRMRLTAALSPQQMTRQMSKTTPKQRDPFNVYKDELDFDDYDKMMKDPQIKAGYELIRNFLLSRKLDIIPADDTPEAQEVAMEVTKALDDMSYPMRKVRNDMYSALIYGYSVSEFVWGMDEDDEKIGISKIKPIPTYTLPDPFKYDKNGDLEAIVQQDPDGGDDIIIPAEKCMVYTYDEQWGDKKGCSILDAVYDNWFMKQDLLQWYQVYLQKHEGPTLAAYVENPMLKDEAQYMMEEIHEGRTNITLGNNDKIEVLESSHRGEGFKEAINYHDVMIFRKMNIGTMILGQENGSGAYAQSQTQYDTLAVFLDGVHSDIATELQTKINQWIDMHHYDVEVYPKVEFESFEDMDLLELLRVLDPFIKDMAINPQDKWFKQVLAKVVNKYTDVDMHEFLEGQKVKDEEQVVSQPKATVVPTPEEKEQPLPSEQADLIKSVGNLFPTKQ